MLSLQCAPRQILPFYFFLFLSLSLSLHGAALVASALWLQCDLKPSLFSGWQGGFCDCHPHDNVERDTGACLSTALALYTHLAGSSCNVLKQPYLPVLPAFLGKSSYPTTSLQPQRHLTFSILRCSVSA